MTVQRIALISTPINPLMEQDTMKPEGLEESGKP